MPKLPVIGLSCGDPKGIGPEIVAKAIHDKQLSKLATFKIFGRSELGPSQLTDLEAAQIALATLREATDAGLNHQIDALVTAPVNKARLRLADPHFTGHTEFFAQICGAKPVMAFVSAQPLLRVALVTRHLPLGAVAERLNAIEILHTIRTFHLGLQQLGLPQPKIAVAGLNPHAGEGGMLGDEEKKFISPAIAQAHKEGILVSGPFPGDTIFWRALQGEFDGVVAMYHDQGLAAVKTVAFQTAVQWSLGLPFIRVSVDHGTAEEISGKNCADITNLRHAIELAITLTHQKLLRHF